MFSGQLRSITQSSRADGSGSLEFGNGSGLFGYGVWANTGMDLFSMGQRVFAFHDIQDVTKVYRLINQARTGPT
jgi:hypothetical protein